MLDLPMNGSPAVTIGPGVMLRNAREAQGMHIATLAVILKIPVKKLEALESDRFDLLPDTVFVRALALSVCRVLKLDAATVMAALPQLQTPPIKTDEVGLNASFKSAGSGLGIASLMQGMKPAVLVMLVLVVAIVVVFFWPASGVQESQAPDADKSDMVLLAGSTQVGLGASIQQDAASQVSSVQVAKLSDALPASTPAIPTSATVTESAAVAVPASSAAAASSPVSGSVLTLQARGESWIDVTDAQGKSQMRKIMAAGEVLQIAGALPLSVVLGRADAVAVLVRGKPLDVTAVAKDNVARFEVK